MPCIKHRSRLELVVAAILLMLAFRGVAMAQTLTRLPALELRADEVTVSGLSSGAYFAGQFAVAYSASVSGAAILAGGPYGCSRGDASTAALKCSCPADKPYALKLAGPFGCYVFSDSVYQVFADRALEDNRNGIDSTANIARQRIWLFSGGKDAVVDAAVVDSARSLYARLGVPPARLHLEHLPSAGHGFPSPVEPLPCGVTAHPFLIKCGGFDAAEALLRWFYADLPANPGTVDSGAFRRFSQTVYGTSGFTGLEKSGWAYVPAACEHTGARCRLHVAFHGCRQGETFRTAPGQTYGRRFVNRAGYNRWAEAGGIVVLYPQVKSINSGNPQGCWDFWGYTTDTADTAPLRFGQRNAPQMKAIKAMIDDMLRSPR